MMKCDENGGCPLGNNRKHFYLFGQCGKKHEGCHLTSGDFPIITAMIAGEWKCARCKHHGLYASGEIFCIFTGTPAPDPCSSWHFTWEER